MGAFRVNVGTCHPDVALGSGEEGEETDDSDLSQTDPPKVFTDCNSRHDHSCGSGVRVRFLNSEEGGNHVQESWLGDENH